MAGVVNFRTLLRGFLVRMCLAWLRRRISFPVLVTLNRFAALLFVFLLFTQISPSLFYLPRNCPILLAAAYFFFGARIVTSA